MNAPSSLVQATTTVTHSTASDGGATTLEEVRAWWPLAAPLGAGSSGFFFIMLGGTLLLTGVLSPLGVAMLVLGVTLLPVAVIAAVWSFKKMNASRSTDELKKLELRVLDIVTRGPTSAVHTAHQLRCSPDDAERALQALASRGHIEVDINPDGQMIYSTASPQAPQVQLPTTDPLSASIEQLNPIEAPPARQTEATRAAQDVPQPVTAKAIK